MMQVGCFACSIFTIGMLFTLWFDLLGISGQAGGGLPQKCTFPMDPGTGKAKIIAYYYNQNSKQCESFTYHGSGGNKNRFTHKKDCNVECQFSIGDLLKIWCDPLGIPGQADVEPMGP
ncbi:kunitz/BPTI-like toxin [Anolis carolinensis]|uniref:kunitz/BPTI-like toxin n=1 Tax=Anolis carolinensis TaxID=28377 RepID=UPI002F2B2A73